MVFKPPSWIPELPDPPDSVSISDYMLDEKHGRRPISASRDPYTCGLTGKTYSVSQVRERVDHLARALAKELRWEVNTRTEYDKIAGVFCFNTIDMMTLFWAIHRLNGVVTPANAAYSAAELTYQLENSAATCLFTCIPFLTIALEAAEKARIPRDRIYLIPIPGSMSGNTQASNGMKTLDDLISAAPKLPPLPSQHWTQGQGTRQTAFLCYSSGTSGLPKGVQISHRNVIANVLQKKIFDSVWRDKHTNGATEIVLGLLPQNHIYALVVVCHTSTYFGDQVIVLPKFEFEPLLQSISRFQIQTLFVVPPILVTMVRNDSICKRHDLSSVKYVVTGAAPLGAEIVLALNKMYPSWITVQAYGLTETTAICFQQARDDIWPGSTGTLYPGMSARIISPSTGEDITAYDTPGELWVQSPSVALGYLRNAQATAETFVEDATGRWMRTGDEVSMQRAPPLPTQTATTDHSSLPQPRPDSEHMFILDRMKELIKVKGNSVAPAELEAHLLTHPAVDDCAVIAIPAPAPPSSSSSSSSASSQDSSPHDSGDEVPKAFVVKSRSTGIEDSEALLKRDIMRHVQRHKARFKWVRAVEFVDVIPKSASGKILRRVLREREKEKRSGSRTGGAKL